MKKNSEWTRRQIFTQSYYFIILKNLLCAPREGLIREFFVWYLSFSTIRSPVSSTWLLLPIINFGMFRVLWCICLSCTFFCAIPYLLGWTTCKDVSALTKDIEYLALSNIFLTSPFLFQYFSRSFLTYRKEIIPSTDNPLNLLFVLILVVPDIIILSFSPNVALEYEIINYIGVIRAITVIFLTCTIMENFGSSYWPFKRTSILAVICCIAHILYYLSRFNMECNLNIIFSIASPLCFIIAGIYGILVFYRLLHSLLVHPIGPLEYLNTNMNQKNRSENHFNASMSLFKTYFIGFLGFLTWWIILSIYHAITYADGVEHTWITTANMLSFSIYYIYIMTAYTHMDYSEFCQTKVSFFLYI